ncbi:MAG: hypothetical protein WB757_13940 [Candidatus Cybelea sp.]
MQISSLLGFSVSAALFAACASIGAPNPTERIADRHGRDSDETGCMAATFTWPAQQAR